MTPSEILGSLTPDCPRRDEAAAELFALLADLASGGLREPCSGKVYRIPKEERPDRVSEACIRVLERSPLPVVGKSDGECRRYLITILARLAIDEGRRRKPETVDDESVANADRKRKQPQRTGSQGRPTGLEAQTGELEDESRLLAMVVDEALGQAASDAVRRGWECDWKQIQELVREELGIWEIVERDEGVLAAAPAPDRKKAQARVLTAHKRFRDKLIQAAARLEEAGRLGPGELPLIQQIIRNILMRRQTPPG